MICSFSISSQYGTKIMIQNQMTKLFRVSWPFGPCCLPLLAWPSQLFFDGVKTKRPQGRKINVIHSILVLIGQLMILVGLILMLTEIVGTLFLVMNQQSVNVNFTGF